MSSRKARRSSILKSRNSIGPCPDGGNYVQFGRDEGEPETLNNTNRNLTGVIQNKRVSFSQTTHVKEFHEKSNSSSEGSLSKTRDFSQTPSCDMDMNVYETGNVENYGRPDLNQTRIGNANMSITMHEGDRQDLNQTRLDNGNMSFTMYEGDGRPRPDLNQTKTGTGNNMSFTMYEGDGRPDLNQTRISNANMSITIHEGDRQDLNQTRLGNGNLSFTMYEGDGQPRPDLNQTKTGTGNNMSVTMYNGDERPADLNQTRIGNANMSITIREGDRQDLNQTRLGNGNMSFTMYEGDGRPRPDLNQTKIGTGNNMSFTMYEGDGLPRPDLNQTKTGTGNNMSFTMYEGDGLPRPDLNQTKTGTGNNMSFTMNKGDERPDSNQARIGIANMSLQHANQGSSKSFPTRTEIHLDVVDPQSFRDPFGKSKRKLQRQPGSSSEKISFGKFANLKTPKRNASVSAIVQNKPISNIKTASEEVQTSPHLMSKTPQQNAPFLAVVHNKTISKIKTASEEVQTSPHLMTNSKTTKDVSLNCTIQEHFVKRNVDVSMMTSPMPETSCDKGTSSTGINSLGSSTNLPDQDRDYVINATVSKIPPTETHPFEQTALNVNLPSTDNSKTIHIKESHEKSISFNEASVSKLRDVSQTPFCDIDMSVYESAACTSVFGNIENDAAVAVINSPLTKTHSLEETILNATVHVPSTAKNNSAAGMVMNKMNDFLRKQLQLYIYEKLTFLQSLFLDLAELPVEDWENIQKDYKSLLNDDFINAVNVQRQVVHHPSKLFQAFRGNFK